MLRKTQLFRQAKLMSSSVRAFAPPPNKAMGGKFAESAFNADGSEELRPEYKTMMNDFNELYQLVHPMIMQHYE